MCSRVCSDNICDGLKVLGHIRHLMKGVPGSLQCIFHHVKLTKVEEGPRGRLTCPTSEQVNDQSGSALWLDEMSPSGRR